MTNLDIKINIKELSNYSGVLNEIKDKKTLSMMIGSFSNYILKLYIRLIEEALEGRVYKGEWEPTEDPGYLEYLGVTPSRHILYDIRESMEVKKIGYNYIVRINPYYKYPGTSIPFIRVLRAIENGTSKFNARPLLSKIAIKIRSNIMDLWKGYLSMKGVM